ncbi:FlgD immunoglobulin-like domain containing protein [Streptomyces sp. NPDC093111]|uniref:FlgD immunoglobulin-like domain containing protein n=1 Tax=Streptomyces sp. NPDC093111 TaxID=3154978 RepID=UPI003413BEDB
MARLVSSWFGPPRAAVAFGLAAALGVSGVLSGGRAAAAEPPPPPASAAQAAPAAPAASVVAEELTIPASPHVTPPDTKVLGAGTGVQWWSERGGRQWWNPASGTSVAAPDCPWATAPFANGDSDGCGAASLYVIRDLATGAVRERDLPEGHTTFGAHTADRVLTAVPDADGSAVRLHLLGVGAGAPADTEVAVPVRMVRQPALLGQDANSAFLRYWDGTRYAYGLVDFAASAFRPTAGPATEPSYPLHALTPDWLVHFEADWRSPVRLVSRADGTTIREVPTSCSENPRAVQTLGDWLVVACAGIRAVHLTSGETTPVLPRAAATLATGTDGGVYATGGADSAHWGLQRIELGPDGRPRARLVHGIAPVPAKRSHVAIHQREVAYVENAGTGGTSIARRLSPTAPLTMDEEPLWSCKVPDGSTRCPEGGHYLGDDRRVTVETEDSVGCRGCVMVVRVADPRTGAAPKVWRLGPRDLRPDEWLGSSGRYLLAKTKGGTRFVFDFETGRTVWTWADSGLTAAALRGDTLWMLKGSRITSLDLVSGAVSEPVDTGTTCTVERFQVADGWAMVHCRYGMPGSVVVDLATKRRVSLTGLIGANAYSTYLGRGFVVVDVDTAAWEASELRVVDVRSGTAVVETLSTRLAALSPLALDIDESSDSLAYLDTGQNLHVVALRGPADRAPEIIDRFTEPGWHSDRRTPWQGAWWVSAPAVSWRVELAEKATGKAVRVLTGDDARGSVAVGWDGRDEAGVRVPNGTYTWTFTATPVGAGGPAARESGELEVTGAAGAYRPLTPARVMDTRSGLGVPKARVGPDGTVTLQVAGQGGVPATGVSAVVLNVTAVNATRSTFVSVHPATAARTSASNLNVVPGRAVSNLVVVPVGAGRIGFYNKGGDVDLLADVAGYYTDDAEGARYKPLAPARAMDTRSGTGVRKAKVGAAGTVTLQVTGRNGVPASGVAAVVMNVTATNVTASTFVSAYPSGTVRTSASNLNATAGRTVPNLVTVPVVDGKVTFYNHAGTVDLLADVAGYYSTAGDGALFQPLTPTRLFDTRAGTVGDPPRRLGPGEQFGLGVTGHAGVPAGASAVVVNLTATNASAATFVSAYPNGTARPDVSNVNVVPGQTVPNLAVVPTGSSGAVTLYNRAGYVDVVADVAGYFVG